MLEAGGASEAAGSPDDERSRPDAGPDFVNHKLCTSRRARGGLSGPGRRGERTKGSDGTHNCPWLGSEARARPDLPFVASITAARSQWNSGAKSSPRFDRMSLGYARACRGYIAGDFHSLSCRLFSPRQFRHLAPSTLRSLHAAEAVLYAFGTSPLVLLCQNIANCQSIECTRLHDETHLS